jgi:hypothetical protein
VEKRRELSPAQTEKKREREKERGEMSPLRVCTLEEKGKKRGRGRDQRESE